MFLVIFTIDLSRIPTNIISAAESRSGWTTLKEISASTSLWCCCSYALEVECEESLFSFHVPSLVMMISGVYQTVSFFLLVGPSYIKYAAFFSSFCSRAIAVRTGPTSGVSILVRRPQVPQGVAPELLGSMNWGSLGGDFIEVHWSKMPGRTFVQKLFLLLAIEMY